MNHKSLAELYIEANDEERALIKKIVSRLDDEEKLWFFEGILTLVDSGVFIQ